MAIVVNSWPASKTVAISVVNWFWQVFGTIKEFWLKSLHSCEATSHTFSIMACTTENTGRSDWRTSTSANMHFASKSSEFYKTGTIGIWRVCLCQTHQAVLTSDYASFTLKTPALSTVKLAEALINTDRKSCSKISWIAWVKAYRSPDAANSSIRLMGSGIADSSSSMTTAFKASSTRIYGMEELINTDVRLSRAAKCPVEQLH